MIKKTSYLKLSRVTKKKYAPGVFIFCVFMFFILGATGLHAQTKPWTLSACITRALEKNISLNQSRLGNEVTKLTWEQSKYNLYPNLNLSDAQNFSFGRSLDPVSYQYTNQSIATNIPSLSSGVTLFGGLHNLNLIRENKLNYEAGGLDIEKLQNDLALSVLAAYMQILLAEEAVNIATEQLALTTTQADRTEKYVNAGKFPELNLLQIRSQEAADKSAKVDAENNLQLARVALMQLLELPVTPDFDIEKNGQENVLASTTLSPEEVYNTALTLQPQIKSSMLKIQAATWDLKAARGILLPSLNLTGTLRSNYSSLRTQMSEQLIYRQENIGYVQGNPSQPVVGLVPQSIVSSSPYPIMNQFSDNFSQLLGFNLTIPIFNNYQVRTAIEKSKISIENAKLNEDAAKVSLRKTIEQAYTDQTGAGKKLTAADEQEKAETRTFGDMEKRFAAGIASTTDFLIEKSNYNKARLSKASAKYDYIYKTKVVDFYLGKPLTF